ncbi:hypothetical protein D7X87_18365 [bacterium D16-54]|nr:hypothetical protein D7X87_18365 [bacterium D16-54]RKJ12628.1 hypothetical protein D7X65_18525 [bacterium D16-56]
MELDVTKVMILLQRRYGSIREIDRLTKELEEAFARGDEVSAAMLLEMRAEEMAKNDNYTEEIWQLAGSDKAALQKLRRLMTSDPAEAQGQNAEEKKVYEIRQRTQILLDKIRKTDQRMNRRVAREKSYYGAEPGVRRPAGV